MKEYKYDKLKVYKFNIFEQLDFVEHCFTTKKGGISEREYTSLNMGINTNDSKDNVKHNYNTLLKNVFRNTEENVIVSDQIHSDKIECIENDFDKHGVFQENGLIGIDGLITEIENKVLSTVYADCTSIFIVDRKKKIVAVVHSGWKGTVLKIGAKAIDIMEDKYGSKTEDILVGIGPSIGPCCYEVGENVINEFKKAFKNTDKIIEKKNDKTTLNLWEANKRLLIERGVLEKNIEVGELCTSCNEELFYSYRRDNGKTGRMAGMIAKTSY